MTDREALIAEARAFLNTPTSWNGAAERMWITRLADALEEGPSASAGYLADLERARELLRPFAEATVISPNWGDESILGRMDYERLKVKHFRAAAAFLAETEPNP